MSAFIGKNILIKGDPIRKEAQAAGAIIPGHLIESDGAGKFQVHGTAQGAARKLFAQETDFIGNENSVAQIDVAYALDDTVQANAHRLGDEVFAILADGETIVEGDELESNGDGTLIKLTTGERVAWALEAVTTSGSTDRIIVEIG